MKEKLIELIKQLDPDLIELVAEVIEKEKEYIDLLRPRGIKEEIRDLIDVHTRIPDNNGDEL